MPRLLVIESSATPATSFSRKLTARAVELAQARIPGLTVATRDLAAEPLPHLDEATTTAMRTPADQRTPEQTRLLTLSDRLVDELAAADHLIVGAPMYNFGIPSTLKAWIDHVLRSGRTFRYTPSGPEGLLTGRSALVILSRGGIYSQGPRIAMDFQQPYLRETLGFIGIATEFVVVEGVSMGADAAAAALAKAVAALPETAWAQRLAAA